MGYCIPVDGSVAPAPVVSVDQIGDGFVTGGNSAPGGLRVEFWRLARAAGISLELRGPVTAPVYLTSTEIGPAPADPFCAGYAGETISQLTTRAQSGGSYHAFIQARGAPSVIVSGPLGISDANAGASASAMWTSYQSYLSALASLCPTSRIVVPSIGRFFAGSTPSGGIAAANAVVDAFNALLAAGVPALGPNYTYVDLTAGETSAHVNPADGVSVLPDFQAVMGARLFHHIVGLFPASVLASEAVPRPPRPRASRPMVQLASTTDNVLITSDNGWRIPAANTLIGARFMFSTPPSTFTNLIFSAPTGLGYNNGWLLALDGSAATKTLNFYYQHYSAANSGAPVLNKAVPIRTGEPFWLFAHGDRTNGIWSLWCAMRETSTTAWTVYCLGERSGVSAWTASDANPRVSFGKNTEVSDPGFTGAVGSVFIAGGSDVPTRSGARALIESIVFDGRTLPDVLGSLPCDEGSGTTCASNIGGSSGTLTGGWYPAGEVAFPGDETPVVVTGSKGSNAALASLISALAAKGFITDSTS
jgi:hypothetical protein